MRLTDEDPDDRRRDREAAKEIVPGALVNWQGRTGVVTAISTDGDGSAAHVDFDEGSSLVFKVDSGALERVRLEPGTQIALGDGRLGVVLERHAEGPYPTCRIALPDEVLEVLEAALRPAVFADPRSRLRRGLLGSADEFNLRCVATDLWLLHQHSPLVSLGNARVDLMPHQVSVAHRVVSKYPHRFLLCDEVGLGKTIEAAMVIKELRARAGVRRVLILVPSGLQRQWQYELKTKFNEEFAILNNATLRHLEQHGVESPWMGRETVITSHSWASWTPERRAQIASVPWDMVVVDEAHHARSQRHGGRVSRTNLHQLVEALIAAPGCQRRAALLLTASPMQLAYHELYSLCDMLDPVLFSSEDDFREHVDGLAGLNQLVEELETGRSVGGAPDDHPRRLSELLDIHEDEARRLIACTPPGEIAARLRERHRLSEILIRNRKAVVGGFMPRHASRWVVELTELERAAHQAVEDLIEKGFRHAQTTGQNSVGFLMSVLQKLLASSSRALRTSLSGRRERLSAADTAIRDDAFATAEFDDDTEAATVVPGLAPPWEDPDALDRVIDLLDRIAVDSKAETLRRNLAAIFEDPDEGPDPKVLVFTEFRETQDMLAEALSTLAETHVFHGQLSPQQKDDAVRRFRDGAGPQILISTEAGGEGRNLQFCHILVNYDLPWNPMKVEQRIGRVDRIGQAHPVSVFNFDVVGTIEGRVLDVLERRIRIFETAVGSLDPILGRAEDDIRRALAAAREERDKRFEDLGARIEDEVARARKADQQLADLIMDSRSYSAEIARTVVGVATPVETADFERYVIRLLKSVNTSVGPESERGERRIYFHPPFSTHHPELVDGQEARRVCFTPSADVDSDLVEFLGFGHPVIDRLTLDLIDEDGEGVAAVRHIDLACGHVGECGWQFVWRIAIGGLGADESLFSVFVGDSGTVDEVAGARLLALSRGFDPREEARSYDVDLSRLDISFDSASEAFATHRNALVERAIAAAESRLQIERQRLDALHERRLTACCDRIDSCRETLDRIRNSPDPNARLALPLWEANLRRAEDEMDNLQAEFDRHQEDLRLQRRPTVHSALFAVARIEAAPTEGGTTP